MNDIDPFSPTFSLFARPSFMAGVASLFDFGNGLFEYNHSLTPEQADFLALRGDWLAVGNDLRRALREHPPAEFAQPAR